MSSSTASSMVCRPCFEMAVADLGEAEPEARQGIGGIQRDRPLERASLAVRVRNSTRSAKPRTVCTRSSSGARSAARSAASRDAVPVAGHQPQLGQPRPGQRVRGLLLDGLQHGRAGTIEVEARLLVVGQGDLGGGRGRGASTAFWASASAASRLFRTTRMTERRAKAWAPAGRWPGPRPAPRALRPRGRPAAAVLPGRPARQPWPAPGRAPPGRRRRRWRRPAAGPPANPGHRPAERRRSAGNTATIAPRRAGGRPGPPAAPRRRGRRRPSRRGGPAPRPGPCSPPPRLQARSAGSDASARTLNSVPRIAKVMKAGLTLTFFGARAVRRAVGRRAADATRPRLRSRAVVQPQPR